MRKIAKYRIGIKGKEVDKQAKFKQYAGFTQYLFIV